MNSSESLATAPDPSSELWNVAAGEEQTRALFVAASLFIVSVLELVLGGVALVFSFLREIHEFWLNAGGYPVMLRDIVLVSYYPLMVVNLCLLVGLTVVICAKLEFPRGFLIFQILALAGGWALMVSSVSISAKNNVENFINNRPLHYKPPLGSR